MAILALHGFTQRGSAWLEAAEAVGGDWLMPDLPGHGGEPVVPWEAAVARIGGFLAAIPPPRVLAGYSMGGRLALETALTSPGLVDELVLVSTSPGIEAPAARAQRRAADGALADRIETVGIEVFVDEWSARPMFTGLQHRGPEWVARDRAARLGNTAAGLAGALRALGQGAQPYRGDRWADVEIPVLLLTGEQDLRYTTLANQMGEQIEQSRVLVIPNAGHALLGEAPEAVADAMVSWVVTLE